MRKFILFSVFLFSLCIGAQNATKEKVLFSIENIYYENSGNDIPTAVSGQSLTGAYLDSLQQFKLKFHFFDSYTKVVVYRNLNKVYETYYHVSPNATKYIDISPYGDGDYVISAEPSSASKVYYAQFQIVGGKMPRLLRNNFYWNRTVKKQIDNPKSYQFSFDAEIRKFVYETFADSFHFIGGTFHDIFVKSDTICNVYIFSESHPEEVSCKFTTEWQNDTVSIVSTSFFAPTTEDYRVLITTAGPFNREEDRRYFCEVYVDNSFVSNSMVSYNFIDIPVSMAQDHPYNVFVKCGHAGSNDPQLYVVGESGTIIAFNDNYVSNGDFDWGYNARVVLNGSQLMSGVIATCTPFHEVEMINRAVDVYVGCPVVHEETNIRKYYEDFFDNFENIMVSAPASLEYDHLAWAVGEKNYDDPYLKLFQFSADDLEKPLAPIDEFLWRKFYTREYADEDGSCLDLYVTPDDSACVYATIKAFWNRNSLGYAWESKVGTSERLFHPRYALKKYAADGDSIIMLHYRLLDYFEIAELSEEVMYQDYVFGNVALTDDEINELKQKVKGLKRKRINEFQTAYDKCKSILANADYKSTKKLLNSAEYSSLLSLCAQTPEFINYAYMNANTGDRLAFRLINDVAVPVNSDVVQQVKLYNQTNNKTADDRSIRYNVQANSVLFVKKLLAGVPSGSTMAFSTNGVTYSNDPNAFSVRYSDQSLCVKFELESDATVSLIVTGPDFQRNNAVSMNRVSMKSGIHSISVPASSSGVYTISFYVDGRYYERKYVVE